METTAYRVRLLVVTCMTLFMAMLDKLVVGLALPSIEASFHVEFSDLQWFVNAYTLAFAVLMIPFSVLGERFGRKRVFLIGVALFTLGSLTAAISTGAMALTMSRVLQGIGGAAIVPISLTLVNGAFPPNKRAMAIGLWSGISGLGLAIGPLVGGAIVEGAPWAMIFWINVPIGVLAIVLGMFWLKESKGEKVPLDIMGILLLGAGLSGVIIGLVRGNSEGWGTFSVWGSMAGGAILLLIFYFWEERQKHPLVRFSLFRNRVYSAYLSAGFWFNAGIFGAIFLLTLFMQQAQGYSALGVGLREMVWTIFTMIGAPIAGIMIGRYSTRKILLVGLFMQLVAMIAFAFGIWNQGVNFPFAYMIPMMILAGAGMGLSFTPLSHGSLSSVPSSAVSEASGIGGAARELGSVFGIAIGGLVFESGGAITSPETYANHVVPAMVVFAIMILIGILSIWLFGRSTQSSETV